ncbi:hypothetical protein CIRMBP1233_02581 [Enterococcus cecorum]|nr:hypothetical protein CIRMBP1219_02647 [Enterococcus cecorum]CAI3498801.1 hypothetical protein CIRMBP1215_02622 [Enterococcus cecorum]CAI3502390.1 hypothetical protein CIRMBP1233_02581 [Enterococcus cecorum]CAI3507886.1 hypothetical protein CIRMBP1223_02724 [Enterococcus cecorum]CAI3509296.1 hypothetical protein CIRMBP1217_02757 [Enterococcus cecorum]
MWTMVYLAEDKSLLVDIKWIDWKMAIINFILNAKIPFTLLAKMKKNVDAI